MSLVLPIPPSPQHHLPTSCVTPLVHPTWHPTPPSTRPCVGVSRGVLPASTLASLTQRQPHYTRFPSHQPHPIQASLYTILTYPQLPLTPGLRHPNLTLHPLHLNHRPACSIHSHHHPPSLFTSLSYHRPLHHTSPRIRRSPRPAPPSPMNHHYAVPLC